MNSVSKRFRHLVWTLAMVSGMAVAWATNPVLRLYSNDITFYNSFDHETTTADFSNGEGNIFRKEGNPTFAPGLFGKSLRTGRLYYRGLDNMDLSDKGTLLFWLSPVQEMTKKPANGREPGGSYPVVLTSYKHNDLFVNKMIDQPWGHGHLNAYVQYPNRKYPHVNCILYDSLNSKGWSEREWRLVAVTWKCGEVGTSVNGSAMRHSTLKHPMMGPSDEICLGSYKTQEGYQLRLDEVVILKRLLTEAEIKAVYEQTMKEVGAAK